MWGEYEDYNEEESFSQDELFAASQNKNAESSGSSDTLTNTELLELSLDQLLHPDFVLKQTRGAKLFEAKKTGKSDDPEEEQNQDGSRLVATVLAESRVEHLAAGFIENRSEASTSNEKDVESRLSRELAAQAYSSDFFSNLARRRAYLLGVLYKAFDEALRTSKAPRTRSKKGSDDESDLLTGTAIKSGVTTVLRLIKDAGRQNSEMCFSILTDLKALLDSVPAMAFALKDSTKERTRELAAHAFQTIHAYLLDMSCGAQTTPVIRNRCVELLLGVAVTTSSLSYFLSVLKLLLFPVAPLKHLSVLPLLHKLKDMRREVLMEQPSNSNHDSRMNVSELSSSDYYGMTMTTDGQYLYTHSKLGLFKVGTGKNGSTPGMLYAGIKGFRAHERASLACVGNRLYYRSVGVSPAVMLVLDTNYLTEVGAVHADGSGSFRSADNSSIAWGAKVDAKAVAKAAAPPPPDPEQLSKLSSDKTAAADGEKKEGDKAADDKDPMAKKIDEKMKKEEKLTPEQEKLKQHTNADKNGEEKKEESKERKTPEGPPGPGAPGARSGAPSASGPAMGGDEKAQDPSQPPQQPGPDGEIKIGDPAAPGAAPGVGALVAAVAAGADDKSKDKKGKGVQVPPLISDGRFLFVGVPSNAKGERLELTMHALDANPDVEDKKRLEHCHTVTLRGAPPKHNGILSCGDRKDEGDGKKKTKARSKKKGTGRYDNLSAVHLGAPAHLNFEGAFTFECWFRIPANSWDRNNGSYQGLFQHGDASYRTYCFVYSNYIYAGCNTQMGTGQVNCYVTDVDFSEWTYLAITYDTANQQWSVYLNGSVSGIPQKSNIGPSLTAADWTLGATPGYAFSGDLAEVRIWKKTLFESEIQKNMRGFDLSEGDPEGLVGYWPLNDGFGLTCKDLSAFSHTGSISNCTWTTGKRPVDSKIKDVEPPPYAFHKKVMSGDATMYTNGESLAVLYPSDIANSVFPGCSNAIFQAFSLETGFLLEECEHMFVKMPVAGSMAPSWDFLYLAQDQNGAVMFHRYHATPPVSQAAWRAARFKEEKASIDTDFPTAKKISGFFPLPALSDGKAAEEENSKKTTGSDDFDECSDDESETSMDPVVMKRHVSVGSAADLNSAAANMTATLTDKPSDLVSPNVVAANILSRLDSECRFVKHVNSSIVPKNLQYLLAVDISKTTFINLLELAEGLTREYFSTKADPDPVRDTANSNLHQLRMFALLTCLRLLRINIMHLVHWRVDPVECGFEVKNKGSATATPATPSKKRRTFPAPSSLAGTILRRPLLLPLPKGVVEPPPFKIGLWRCSTALCCTSPRVLWPRPLRPPSRTRCARP